MIMPFGRHRGKKLDDVPLDYLAWVLENCANASPYLRDGIRRIISREADSQAQQQDALCSPGLL
jgi:hypothetical protein